MSCGVMAVRCEQKAAALMASKMLGVELEKVDHSVADALGEICNMVTGNFKNEISGLGDGCTRSPPSVLTGDDDTVHPQPETPTMEVSMLFETMPLVISLHIPI